jgi:hypothetical protein
MLAQANHSLQFFKEQFDGWLLPLQLGALVGS